MMMISSSSATMKVHFFLFLILLHSFSFFSHHHHHHHHPFVHGDELLDWNHIYGYCEKTKLPVLCGSCMLVKSGPGIPEVYDLQSMIMKVLRCAHFRAMTTQDNIEKMSLNATDPNLVEPLYDCNTKFGRVVPSWLAAIQALKAGNHDDAKIGIWKAQGYALGCLDIFQKYPNVTTVPTRVLSEMIDYQTLTHVITALVDQL